MTIEVWIGGAFLSLVVVAALAWPLLRRRQAADGGYETAVYADQLAEVSRDVERGVLEESEASPLRQEIERRMARAANETSTSSGPGNRRLAVTSVIALLVLIPFVGFGIYTNLGTPDFADQPYADRIRTEPPTDPAARRTAEIVEQLHARLEAGQGDLRGWVLLGRSLIALERPLEAAKAFQRARALAPDRADIAADLGEAMVMAQDGLVSDDALAALAAAQQLAPRDTRALFYIGLAAAQRGAYADAVQQWTNLLAVSAAEAPWRAEVEARRRAAAEAGGIDLTAVKPAFESPLKGPTAADMDAAAQMTPEERRQMIRSMVEGLAARLEETPDDLDGWRRLARAYRVLGETEKADNADARIKALEAER